MPRVDEESKLTKAVIALREWIPGMKQQLQERYTPIKESPQLVWHLPEVRIPIYILGGLVVLWIGNFALGFLRVEAPGTYLPRATTADFHVLCTNPNCQEHFVIHKKISFDDFPVTCPFCKQTSGARALRCHSSACQGKLVATQERQGAIVCRTCGQIIKQE